MSTTIHPYSARILGMLGDKPPLVVLETSPKKLEQQFKRLGLDGLKKSYAPGKWTAGQIVSHLADVEMATGYRFRQAVYDPNHRIQPYDQDLWARTYPRQDPGVALQAFQALRAWNLSFWSLLTAEELARVAFHPERGEESVETLLKLLAGHDLNHLGQLEKIR